MALKDLPPITCWQEVQELRKAGWLTAAEQRLIEACRVGRQCFVGEIRPEVQRDEITIRAPLLRYLILGGCDGFRVHAWGVSVCGAWIQGCLDLSLAKARGQPF